MITEVVYSGLIVYSLLTSLVLTGGMAVSFLASLELHSYKITWRTLKDFLTLAISALTLSAIWPFIILFIVFLSIRYSIISMTYSS